MDDGGLDGNFGEILRPATVQLQFRGNPAEQVTAMPDNLAIITGDAKAATNDGANANAAWTCTGFEDLMPTAVMAQAVDCINVDCINTGRTY